MSKRSALVSLVIVVASAAIAGGWLLHQGPATIVAPAPLPAPAVAPERDSADEPRTKRSRSDGEVFVNREKEGMPSPEPSKTLAIDGVVIVTDSQGVEHREESGTLTPQFRPARRGEDVARLEPDLTTAWQSGEEVTVTAGRFHVEVPSGRQFTVQKAVLGGRAAQGVGDPVDAVAGRSVTVRARWIDGIRLHVVDATSRVEFDDVTVVRVRERYVATHAKPGAYRPEDRVVDHAASPVLVAASSGSSGSGPHEVLFARAAGHAWGHVSVDFSEMTELTLELGPAATLLVEVSGELPRRASRPPSLKEVGHRFFVSGGSHTATVDSGGTPALCLRAPSDAPDFDAAAKAALERFDGASAEQFPGGRKPTLEEYQRAIEEWRGQYEATPNLGELELSRPAAIGETRLDSLEPGDFFVSVEIGEPNGTPLVAGRAAVKLVAGETARASLILAPVAPVDFVPLSGTLFVPDGWDSRTLALTIEPFDLAGSSRSDGLRMGVASLVRLPGRPGWVRWSAGVVPPATYEFTIEEALFEHVEKIGPSGNDHVELKLGEPALLIVHVVDEASGQSVPLRMLRYTAAYLDGWFGTYPSTYLARDAGRDGYAARVPVGAGRIELCDVGEWTLEASAAPLEVHSGEQEVTLRVHRTSGVLLALACGGAKVDWTEELAFECKIEPVGDAGKWLWTNSNDGLPRLAVARAGRYRVKIPAIPGFAPVEPFEVDVPAGRFVTKTVELTRK